MRITTSVAALYLRHPLGRELKFFPSRHSALDWLHWWVVPSWCDLTCEDGTDCGVPGCPGVPDDARDLTGDEAIAVYFAHRRDTCSWSLTVHEIEMDLGTEFTDLAAELRQALDATDNAPGLPVRRLRSAVDRALTALTPPHPTRGVTVSTTATDNPDYAKVRRLRRGHLTASLLEYVEHVNRTPAPRPGTIAGQERHTLVTVLELAAEALIGTLDDGDPVRARQILDWAQRPDRPRTRWWVTDLVDSLRPVLDGTAGKPDRVDGPHDAPVDVAPPAEDLARDLLELPWRQPDLDAEVVRRTRAAATVLVASLLGGDHQRALEIVDHTPTAHTVDTAPSTDWLAEAIAQAGGHRTASGRP